MPPLSELIYMQKSLDAKIADIRANPSTSKAFIIADAKDADMALGITAPGPHRPQNPEQQGNPKCGGNAG